MKNLIYVSVAVLVMAFTSCGNKTTEKDNTTEETVVVDINKGKSVEAILDSAASNVGKEVVIRGIVDHTCSHSGRRCFILGDNPELTMRVEAKGNIGGFNRELSGSELAIKGILREKFVSEEEIKAMEQLAAEKAEKEGADHCDSEMKAIQSMRKWMKDNNKEAFSEYYIDGTDFEVIE